MVGGNSYARIGVKTSSSTSQRKRTNYNPELISLVSHFDYLEKFGKFRQELLVTMNESQPFQTADPDVVVVDRNRPSKLHMRGVLSFEDSDDQTPC